MIFLELLRWWYGPGWVHMIRRISGRAQKINQTFAISSLVGTLFAPWKRIMTVGAKNIDEKMRALVDNLVSRCIGFVVRSTMLLTALFMLIGSFIYGVLLMLVWPLVPVLAVYLFLLGLV